MKSAGLYGRDVVTGEEGFNLAALMLLGKDDVILNVAPTYVTDDILMFLHNNPQNNTAAEIVKIRKSTKSHVSTSLKTLENKGLVERKQSKENKKHIEIFLLDKAELIVEAGLNAQKEFAKNVLSGMTDEEKHMCMKVFDKICNNAEKCLREHKEKANEN